MPKPVIIMKVPMRVDPDVAAKWRDAVIAKFPDCDVLVLDAFGIDLYRMPSDERLDRIEGKLDALLRALAEDEEEPQRTLDGDLVGGERDQGQPL